jgi:hypothetical protein
MPPVGADNDIIEEMVRWLFNRLNFWVILVALLIAAGLGGIFWALVYTLPPPVPQAADPQVGMTVIIAPTPTLTPTRVIFTPTPTNPPSVGGFAVGNYVQISGTDGQGLRIRSGPGTANPARFLGMDSEVFQIKDGPEMADDFTWWFLEAPYDPARSGWAASLYLEVITAPTLSAPSPTP